MKEKDIVETVKQMARDQFGHVVKHHLRWHLDDIKERRHQETTGKYLTVIERTDRRLS